VFLWYLLQMALTVVVLATATVLAGMCSTFISLFCGFMIKSEDFPSFWIFMYWLDPLHYVLEGLVGTQFNRDNTVITITGSPITTTASNYVRNFYTEFRYEHRGYDVLALVLFILAFRYVHYASYAVPLNLPCRASNFWPTGWVLTCLWSTCVTTSAKQLAV
jgi:ABC-type multidrug transport system permease subunit